MARSLKTIANQGDQNKLGAVFQAGRLGSAVHLIPRFFKGTVASNVLVLPQHARAAAVLTAFATAGTSAGAKTYVAGGTAAAGQVSINAVGNIVFNGTDAVTAAEVIYVTVEGDIIEEIVPVVSHVATPSFGRNAVLLLEAEALAGTLPGDKVVDLRGASIATTEAGLNFAGTGVVFATADAVTSARIKYVATPGVGSQKPAIGANWDAADWAF